MALWLVFVSFSLFFFWFLFYLRYFVVDVAYVDEHFAVNIVEAVTAVAFIFSIFSVVRVSVFYAVNTRCAIKYRPHGSNQERIYIVSNFRTLCSYTI